MNCLNIFKIYNKKLIKKEKLMIVFTALSILLSICITLTVQQFENAGQKFVQNNAVKINGGDLYVHVIGRENKDFDKKVEELKNAGISEKISYGGRGSFIKNANKIASSVIAEETGLSEDEVILSSNAAKSLGVKKGEKIKLSLMDKEKQYTVKDIEYTAMAVDKDSAMLGYGKINKKNISDFSKWGKMIFLSGKDGEKLKEELVTYAENYKYTTLNDRKNQLRDNTALESVSLGMLSNVTFILSIMCIITTTVMIIMKRMRDISIMRMLSVKTSDIKKATLLEMMFMVIPSIIAGALSSVALNKVLCSYRKYETEFTFENAVIVAKGTIFGILIFIAIVMICLRFITNIKPLMVFREDEEEMRKRSIRTIKTASFAAIIALAAYGFVMKNTGSLISMAVIVLFAGLFLVLASLIVKILCSIKYRNMKLMYSFKAVKKNFMSFILVVVSITMTLWFVLIGYYLNSTIKNNMQKAISSALPYNYLVSECRSDIEGTLNNDKDVKAFTKVNETTYTADDKKIKKMYSNVTVDEIEKKDYNLKFNITDGKNLFENAEGNAIVSDELFNRNKLHIGDSINVKDENGKEMSVTIKGVYKCVGINGVNVYKEGKSCEGDAKYLISAESEDIVKKLTGCEIYNINTLSSDLTSSLLSFMSVFRILSIITIISAILFNFNIVSISLTNDRKNEEIIEALGLGRRFIKYSKNVKIVSSVILSCILSIGIYGVSIKFFFKSMFKYGGTEIGISTILICLAVAVFINIITFNMAQSSKRNFDLIREQ